MNKKEFCKEYNLTEEQFTGEVKINGSLHLRGLTSIPDGFNPTVGEGLYLNNLTSIPEGFNPTVGGGLDLSGLTSIPQGFNPTVGGYLDLNSLTSIPDGFNPTVGEGLYLNNLTSIPEGFNPTVGGGLDLNSLTSIPDGFNPTVGEGLYLNNLTSIPEGFNPTVGEGLYLNNLTSIPEGFNPTVGGGLDLGGLTCDYTKLIGPVMWGDKYIKADGIFTEIISVRGGVFRVKELFKEKVFYLVTDGNGRYAHGDSLSEAREDLIYKLNSDVNKDDFKNLKLTDKLSFEQAVSCYRAITGACSFGVKDFVERNKINKKEKYSVTEIINLTKGEFGSEVLQEFLIK